MKQGSADAHQIRGHLVLVSLLVLAVAAVYGQILGHEFISNWDDNLYVTNVAEIRGFTLQNIRTVFSSYYAGNYAPVQMLSYMLDYQLWGLWPGGFLLTNLVIHTVNGLLIYRLFLRMHGETLLAALGAAVFLLHPVQVETVAWVSQRKNLLAMLFFLLTWEWYRCYREAGNGAQWKFFWASVAAFALSLLAKSAAVILPVVLVMYDHCFPGLERRFRVLDKVPYIVAAGVVAAIAMQSQMPVDNGWNGAGGGRTLGYHGGSLLVTFFTMLPVFCSYLGMLFRPTAQSAYYAPPIHAGPDLKVALCALLIAGVVLLCYRLYRHDRRLGFWPLYFMVGFLPVSQIVPLVTLMNDRYFYFPIIGGAALLGVGVTLLRDRLGLRRGWLMYGAAAGLVLVMALGSYQRAAVWQNSVTLWLDAVAKVPDAETWRKLGEAYIHYGPSRSVEAEDAFSRSLALNPVNVNTLYALGSLYADAGDYDSAFDLITALLKVQGDHVMALAVLGDIHKQRGEYGEAEKAYRRAQKLQPDAMQVLALLGDLALLRGRYPEARSYFSQIEQQWVGDPLVALNLARTEAGAGEVDKALEWLEKAMQRGLPDYRLLQEYEELAPIRKDIRFAVLLKRYGVQSK